MVVHDSEYYLSRIDKKVNILLNMNLSRHNCILRRPAAAGAVANGS